MGPPLPKLTAAVWGRIYHGCAVVCFGSRHLRASAAVSSCQLSVTQAAGSASVFFSAAYINFYMSLCDFGIMLDMNILQLLLS